MQSQTTVLSKLGRSEISASFLFLGILKFRIWKFTENRISTRILTKAKDLIHVLHMKDMAFSNLL